MNRFEKVQQILDASVGGPTAPVSFHGPFWRGMSRNDFVAHKVYGLPLIVVGDGAGSNLVKALKGETPFGADIGNPDADYNRMPSGRLPVSTEDIAFIELWIDEGCLEDSVVAVSPLTWRKTNAPVASSRTDDIWFLDPKTGWGVNSDGTIMKTEDGGDSWSVQYSAPGVYLRCIGFSNGNKGWVGTLSRNRRLFQTVDGGSTWTRVTNLPMNAPVAICGISVVNERVVYGSGTNRPEDSPGMIKTIDGGVTWSAIDMSPHASILIDTYFTDSMHGWVVGGKASEPTPTTRDKVKPVVLETSDGGATWINRLAGEEADFPFGEWGWKIQFLNDQVGFVSLENFAAGAILKTNDGGKSWKRMVINDPQGNKNLEGVGFIDERTGWVGGWGSDFTPPGPTGFSSATSDGGATWSNANDIGLRINRFRFFGNPVTIGYASGFTVYKYSSTPLPASVAFHAAQGIEPLLRDSNVQSATLPIAIRMNIPEGTRRITVHVWDRFGVDHGIVHDEVRPQGGRQVFHWDGMDDRGQATGPGDYIIRITSDDKSSSTTVSYRPVSAAAGMDSRIRAKLHLPAVDKRGRQKLSSVAALLDQPIHDLDWLRNALQIAIQLELATLPPYLTARWTIKDSSDPVAESILEVRGEEMLHLGLACNMLVAVDGTPLLADESVVPKYPGPLPGGVRPGLVVTLRKLDRAQAGVFMEIEYPQTGPIALVAAPPETIGAFYEAILTAFQNLNPTLQTSRQIAKTFGFGQLFKIDSLDKVKEAIGIITLQGEGSAMSPEESEGDLSHYYQFGEIFHEKRFVKDESGNWGYNGPDLPSPEVHDMADIPPGGYQPSQVPDMNVWDKIQRFDQTYSDMLRLLQETWTHGTPATLGQAVSKMFMMGTLGEELVTLPRPDGPGNYGPCFRFLP